MSSSPRKRILGPPIQPQVEENSVPCKPLMPFRSRLPQSECQPGSVQRELSSHLHYFPKRGSRLVPGSRFPIHGIAAIFSNHVCIRTTASIRVSVCRAGRFTRVHSFSPRSEPQEVAGAPGGRRRPRRSPSWEARGSSGTFLLTQLLPPASVWFSPAVPVTVPVASWPGIRILGL